MGNEPGPLEESAEFELSPDSPTPRWTRLVIQRSNGELWVAACNFSPEIMAVKKNEIGANVTILHREDGTGPYIKLEWARSLGGEAQMICDAIDRILPMARVDWARKKTARRSR